MGNSHEGNLVGETAKSLPACKTVSSTTFALKNFTVKVVREESRELLSNEQPRQMIIRVSTRQNPAYVYKTPV